jgi:hypothetical protein
VKPAPRCATCPDGTRPHWAHVEVWRPDETWIPSCADGSVRWFHAFIEPLIDDAVDRRACLAPRAWIRQLS